MSDTHLYIQYLCDTYALLIVRMEKQVANYIYM